MLLHLPDELLLAIANAIPSAPELQSLVCTCTRLYGIALPAYYRAFARTKRCDALVAAAVHGNVRAVKLLVKEEGWMKGSSWGKGRGEFRVYAGGRKYGKGSALVAAIESGRSDIALLVLEYGADPNADAGSVGNALEAAVDRQQTEVAQALLRHGANVEHMFSGERSNRSALLIAARKGYTEIVEMLLDHGVDAGAAVGHERMLPLLMAAVNGHLACVEALIERGANDELVEGLDDKWLPGTAFSIVSREERWRHIFDVLLDRMDYSSPLAGNAFVSVARDGEVGLVEHFLRNRVDLEKHGPRAVGVASLKGHLHIVQRLLAAGVDVTQEVPKRGPALLRAAHHGHVYCVEALLAHGASPNVVFGTPRSEWRGHSQAVFCNTPLQAVCWGRGYAEKSTKYEEIARMLLEAGADPNVSGARWYHPLNLAAYRGNEAIVRLLLKHGSDPSARGPMYMDNALQAAVQSCNIDIVKLLLEHGAEIAGSGALQSACGAAYPNEVHLEMAKLLLDHGADPNDKKDAFVCTGYINALSGQQPGSTLYTPLEVARRRHDDCNDPILKLLWDRGARDGD
ncbi:hypothetical protein PMIN02_010239 [Paraphaeosphaeria minitans]